MPGCQKYDNGGRQRAKLIVKCSGAVLGKMIINWQLAVGIYKSVVILVDYISTIHALLLCAELLTASQRPTMFCQ